MAKNKKVCKICGKEFFAPPSSKKVTCSAKCSSARKSMTHTGKKYPWCNAARARYAANATHQAQARTQIKVATEAAAAIPEGQRGSQNRECKTWILKAPDGTLYRAIGLLPWARKNYALFEPLAQDPEAAAARIKAGFMAIASSVFYGAKSRAGHAVTKYKGWELLYVGEKGPNEQYEAMMAYHKQQEEKNAD